MRTNSYRLATKKLTYQFKLITIKKIILINNMNTKKYISLIVALATFGSLALAVPVFAQGQTNQPGAQNGGRFGRGMMNGTPNIVGKVTAISGNTITVSSTNKDESSTTTTKTFTVDATNAKITKNNTTGTIASITVGDTVAVQGTVSGTNVVAVNIRDGVVGQEQRDENGMGINGTVASISGTTLTVTSKAKPNGGTAITYTVNASSATVTKNGVSSSVSSIAVGDTVRVKGTVSGTNVTAKTIMDGVGQQQPEIQGNGQPVVAGKVTTISGNTITITNSSNVTYTIDATNSKFVVSGITTSTISNVAVGDSVVVQEQ